MRSRYTPSWPFWPTETARGLSATRDSGETQKKSATFPGAENIHDHAALLAEVRLGWPVGRGRLSPQAARVISWEVPNIPGIRDLARRVRRESAKRPMIAFPRWALSLRSITVLRLCQTFY